MRNFVCTPGLVSVVIPTYNNAKYIVECVESVENQTYQNIEIIIIDDGSTDDTESVVQGLQEKYQNIVYKKIINSKSPTARNEGILMARGEYTASIDADDIWVSHKISTQVSMIKDHPNTIAIGGVQVFRDRDVRLFEKTILPPEILSDENYTHEILSIRMDQMVLFNTLLAPTNILQQSGLWDAKFITAHDWEDWVRLSKIAKFIHTQDVFQLYRKHDNSTTSKHKKFQALNYQIQVVDLHAGFGSKLFLAAFGYRRIRYESWIRIYLYTGDIVSAVNIFSTSLWRSNMLLSWCGVVVFKEILVALAHKVFRKNRRCQS
jgi:glycosyltransferase involved in cell wall biosynthesis